MNRTQPSGAHIQRTSTGGFPFTLLFVFTVLLLQGCFAEYPDPHYGAPYEIIVNEISSAPDKPPRITGDWLMVTLAYAGGCTDHEFDLETFARRDTAYIWLFHTPNDDTCESWVYDDLNIELPAGIRDAEVIAMFDPDGGPPYILKWR